MRPPVIECKAVAKSFGPAPAVDGISLALGTGEVLSILGPSGAGKTTLLRLIAGFERLDGGEISIQGRVVSGTSQHVPPDRRNVGMVFQEYALFPHKTVAENVTFGLHKLGGLERDRRLAEVIELVKLGGLEGRYPHELSGGQQQRAALARTIAPRPSAVLLDEPFSNLDAGLRREMRREVAGILRESGTATIIVTHDQEAAFSIGDRVGVVRDGRLEQVDAPHVIYESPATQFVAKMVGDRRLYSGRDTQRDGRYGDRRTSFQEHQWRAQGRDSGGAAVTSRRLPGEAGPGGSSDSPLPRVPRRGDRPRPGNAVWVGLEMQAAVPHDRHPRLARLPGPRVGEAVSGVQRAIGQRHRSVPPFDSNPSKGSQRSWMCQAFGMVEADPTRGPSLALRDDMAGWLDAVLVVVPRAG